MADTPTVLPAVHPLDLIQQLLDMIPKMNTSVVNPDGTLNTSAGGTAAPIPTQPAAAATPAKPDVKPAKQIQQPLPSIPQLLTDAILNKNQITPVQKAQTQDLSAGAGNLMDLLTGKTASANDASTGSKALKALDLITKLFG